MTTDDMRPQSIPFIKERIRAATEHSPIAVFTIVRNGVKHLTAVFASTFETQQNIKMGHPDLVGVFSCIDTDFNVNANLRNAMR